MPDTIHPFSCSDGCNTVGNQSEYKNSPSSLKSPVGQHLAFFPVVWFRAAHMHRRHDNPSEKGLVPERVTFKINLTASFPFLNHKCGRRIVGFFPYYQIPKIKQVK